MRQLLTDCQGSIHSVGCLQSRPLLRPRGIVRSSLGSHVADIAQYIAVGEGHTTKWNPATPFSSSRRYMAFISGTQISSSGRQNTFLLISCAQRGAWTLGFGHLCRSASEATLSLSIGSPIPVRHTDPGSQSPLIRVRGDGWHERVGLT